MAKSGATFGCSGRTIASDIGLPSDLACLGFYQTAGSLCREFGRRASRLRTLVSEGRMHLR